MVSPRPLGPCCNWETFGVLNWFNPHVCYHRWLGVMTLVHKKKSPKQWDQNNLKHLKVMFTLRESNVAMENPPAIVRGFSQRTKPPYFSGIVQPDTFDYQRVTMLDERSRCIIPCGGHWQIQVKGLPIVSHHPETTLNDLKKIEKRSTTILVGLYCPVFLGLVIKWAVQMAEKKKHQKNSLEITRLWPRVGTCWRRICI